MGAVTRAGVAYTNAQNARDSIADRWDANSENVQQLIRQTGLYAENDDPRLAAADQRAVTAGYVQSRLTTQLNAAEDNLDRRREDYRNAIEDYVDELDREVRKATPAEANNLRREMIRNQQLATTLLPPTPRADWAQFVVRDPRDGPDQLIVKAEILKRQIADGLGALERAQSSLDRLKKLRLQLSGPTTSTFDPAPPVGNAGRAGGAGATGRGAGDGGLTVDQQIEQLEKYISELRSRQSQLATREGQFRQLARPQP